MAVLDPGDEVIIPAPYWVSYPDMALLADGVPVMPMRRAGAGLQDHAQAAGRRDHAKTRLFLVNSPSNPTGAAYTAAELARAGRVLLEHPRIVIGTDDMYEKIYWGSEPFTSLLTVVPELYDRTVTINGVLQGLCDDRLAHRLLRRPEGNVTAMGTIQGQSTSNACSISQKAAVAALNGDQACVAT
jgi:aspartate aminotransferase